jgi:peptidoglycan hydrolase-like protein with peptidoglycan-binding domain
MDGELYEPYRADIIRHIQQVLKERGLYAGPINGILDRPTMKAIYSFQQATRILQMCGVPTPNTRKMLRQGSHTDLAS